MEAWEVLETAIPRKASVRIAQLLGVSADYVRRWRREPESDDAPMASGQRSILDRVCDLIDAVFLVNPSGAGLIVNHIESHYRGIMRTHAKPVDDLELRVIASADLLQEAVEAVNHLNLEGCTPETLVQVTQLRDAATAILQSVESSMKKEANCDENY